jgi:hypothetical protein
MAAKPRKEVLKFFKREKVISFYTRLHEVKERISELLKKSKPDTSSEN